jgi:uncharacterized coiled-coil protein SlyX
VTFLRSWLAAWHEQRTVAELVGTVNEQQRTIETQRRLLGRMRAETQELARRCEVMGAVIKAWEAKR